MKKIKIFVYVLLVSLLTFNCSKEELTTQEVDSFEGTLFNRNELKYNYLSYDEALTITTELIDNSRSFLYSQQFDGDVDVKVIQAKFWQENQNILSLASEDIGLQVGMTPENLEQFTDIDVNVKKINESVFLNDIQKRYAIDLLNAANDNNYAVLTEIKNRFKEDVKDYPELEIFNIGIAFIEAGENNSLFLRSDGCWEEALGGAIVSGVVGMVSGAVTGGVGGVAVGTILTGGILAIPAGGAGALVGAI